MTTLRITFASDWHVGTGAGVPGDVDAVVRRDDDGLPVVPARTVLGMWRDGCERVAAALGDPWPDWVEVLFGRARRRAEPGRAPRAGALSVRTARLDDGLRAALRAEPDLVAALFPVRPGVRIDRGTGQARTGTLRAVEVARTGLTLHAPYALDDAGWDDAQRRTAAVLLTLGAEQVRAVGGHRRRGLGACAWALPVADDVARVLAADAPPAPAPLPTPAVPGRLPVTPAGGTWTTIELAVRCVDPVVSTAVATDVLVRGLATVPGGRVLPAVIAHARAAGIELEPLIASGGLRCGPLVPEVAGMAAHPAPLTFGAPKGATAPVHNRLVAPPPDGVALKPLRDRWVGPGPTVAVAATEVRMHNAVDDRVQRPTTDVGGLFGYEAIPAGTRLRGTLRVRHAAAAALAAALTGRWRLGLARKGEYGRVDVTAAVAAPAPARPAADPATVTVLFRTDAVLLDDRLGPVATLDGVLAALGAALGGPVETIDAGPGTVGHAVAFGRTDAWQARWTRPRPTLATVTAGSVLRLRRTDGTPVPDDVRAALAADGIGERRAEGYGQLAVDDPLLAAAVVEPTAPAAVVAEDAAAAPAPDAADRVLLTALRLQRDRRAIEARAATLPRTALGALAGVTPTQRAMLRATLAVTDDAGSAAVAAGLDGPSWTDEARRQVRGLVGGDAVWGLLGLAPVPALRAFAVRRVLAHLDAGGATAARVPAPEGRS